MSKSYTVLLNPQACNLQTVGNSHDNKRYTVDWSAIKTEGEYNLIFSFMAEVNDVSEGPFNIPLIFATFIPSSTNYQVHQGVTAHSSRVLGFLKPYNTTETSYYSADVNTNPSIYLKSRPMLNDFIIRRVSFKFFKDRLIIGKVKFLANSADSKVYPIYILL